MGLASSATYELKLKQVQERELPELTDEWVSQNTEWEGVDEMRDAILSQMRTMKIVEAQMSQRDAVLMAVSELVSEEAVPEILVESETAERLHELGQRLGQQKLNLETFLQITNQTPDQLLDSLRRDAVRAVRIDLAMRALVKAEGLEPTPQEVDDELEHRPRPWASTPRNCATNLRDSGRTVAFNAEVAKMNASRWLHDHVTFVDPDGVEIDRDLLKADQSEDSDA
jgi:trigger factor